MAAAKDCHTCTSYFVKQYKEKYGHEPIVNRFSARWGFDSVLSDMSLGNAKKLIDYYLRTTSVRQHDLDWFFSNYEKLIKSRIEQEKDGILREKLRKESKERAERWKQQRGD